MSLEKLKKEYDKLQKKYGAKELDAIYFGGCKDSPDFCFVFMNPTSKNVASFKEWKGLKAPWIGTKNIWELFYEIDLLDKDVYEKINSLKSSEWTEEFADEVYANIAKHKVFITNLGKCTQIDARQLPNRVYREYVSLLEEELKIINPKVIILFGNQVSSIVLNKKISVSLVRKELQRREIKGKEYDFFVVNYPVGNNHFNIEKSIEDIKWIKEKYRK